MNSAIYLGAVRHRRFSPSTHNFSYPLYMLALDLDELELVENKVNIFSSKKFSPLRFKRNDYIGDFDLSLKQAVLNKVNQLKLEQLPEQRSQEQVKVSHQIDKVIMFGQVRCFGIYFSPVNFFFCYQDGKPVYMLAEVRNTPWNQRHCYLIDLANPAETEKQFHVSPFMDLDMVYRWKIDPPDRFLKIHIENWREDCLFDATLRMKREKLNNQTIKKILLQWPLMTLSIFKNIYIQAFKLYRKKVPFYSHT